MALPLTHAGHTAQFPIIKRIRFNTAVSIGANGSEVRAVKSVPLFDFEFPYNSLMTPDRDALVAFFNAQKGMSATQWSAALGTVNFDNLVFLDDQITITQAEANLWQTKLRFRQVKNAGYTIPARTGFPQLTGGQRFQYPFSKFYRNVTAVGESPSGYRYSFSYNDGGLSFFPTRPLLGWKLQFPVLSDVDVAIIENHFVSCQGRFGGFDMTDDDATVYEFCRYDTDVLEITYQSQNVAQVQFTILETNPRN